MGFDCIIYHCFSFCVEGRKRVIVGSYLMDESPWRLQWENGGIQWKGTRFAWQDQISKILFLLSWGNWGPCSVAIGSC